MEGHVIICGYGRNGKQSTIELGQHNQPFIVIEQDEDVINQIKEDGIDLFIHGNATHDEILERAGVTRAKALITTFPNDADNTFVVYLTVVLRSGNGRIENEYTGNNEDRDNNEYRSFLSEFQHEIHNSLFSDFLPASCIPP